LEFIAIGYYVTMHIDHMLATLITLDHLATEASPA